MFLHPKSIVAFKSILVLMLILIFNYSLNAQWARVFGSSGDEELFSICQISNGDYIAVGYHYEPHADNPLVMKITHDGEIKWRNYYGFFNFIRPQIVLPTVDEGCIVAGYRQVFGEDFGIDIWIIKLDKQGKILWVKISGKPYNETCSAMTETRDGGYLLAGELDSKAFVMKLSSDGEVIWQKSYATKDSSYSGVSSIQQTMDGGIITAGYVQFPTNRDIWICKMAGRGGIVWESRFGGSPAWDNACSVVETLEGNYTVCGTYDNEICIVQLSPRGEIMWQKKYVGKELDSLHSICHTTDGGYIAVGKSLSYAKRPAFGTSYGDIFLIRLSSQGDIQWQKVYGGDFSPDEGFSVQQTINGSFIIAGTTSSWGAGGKDALVLKLWRNGKITPLCSFIRKAKATATEASVERIGVRTKIKKTNIKLNQINTIATRAKGRIYSLGENSVHKLTIKASKWGTTDPPPGVYYFANGLDVTIKAIPDNNNYRFAAWEGHIQTLSENLTFTLDGDKVIKGGIR